MLQHSPGAEFACLRILRVTTSFRGNTSGYYVEYSQAGVQAVSAQLEYFISEFRCTFL